MLRLWAVHCTNKVWWCQHKGDFWYMLLKKQSWPQFSAVLQLSQFHHACCNKECFSSAWTAAGMWLRDSLHLEKNLYLYSFWFVSKFWKLLFLKGKKTNPPKKLLKETRLWFFQIILSLVVIQGDDLANAYFRNQSFNFCGIATCYYSTKSNCWYKNILFDILG